MLSGDVDEPPDAIQAEAESALVVCQDMVVCAPSRDPCRSAACGRKCLLEDSLRGFKVNA